MLLCLRRIEQKSKNKIFLLPELVRNSPLTLAIAVIGEAPPQTHFFPLLVVGSHSCTSPLYSLLVTPFFAQQCALQLSSVSVALYTLCSTIDRRCYSSWLVGGDPLHTSRRPTTTTTSSTTIHGSMAMATTTTTTTGDDARSTMRAERSH